MCWFPIPPSQIFPMILVKNTFYVPPLPHLRDSSPREGELLIKPIDVSTGNSTSNLLRKRRLDPLKGSFLVLTIQHPMVQNFVCPGSALHLTRQCLHVICCPQVVHALVLSPQVLDNSANLMATQKSRRTVFCVDDQRRLSSVKSIQIVP